MEEWRTTDIAGEIAALTGCSTHLANDATAACAAEHVFGSTGSADYLYFFVGAFIGGGIVIDGDLVAGRNSNAGALGSMLVPGESGGFDQLINSASIHVLEKMLAEAGRDSREFRGSGADWNGLGPVLDRWLLVAARGLAHAITAAISVYDFECAVIDGSFPPEIRARLVGATRDALSAIRREGLSPIDVRPGTIGPSARAIGAASLPFFARFLLDHRVRYAETP